MKKRWIALLMAACIVAAPVSCFAESIVENAPVIEDFSLHKGSMFGDTVADVKAKEEADGSAKLGIDYTDTSMCIMFYDGTFAGIGDSTLRYAFTKNDNTLYMTTYMFRNNDEELVKSIDNQNEEFDYITDELTKRYGNPFFDEGDGIPFIYGKYDGYGMNTTGFAQYYIDKELFDDSPNIELKRYNQWLIKAEDKYVLIDHFVLREGGAGYYHWLSYVNFDEDTAKSILGEYADAVSANDDL